MIPGDNAVQRLKTLESWQERRRSFRFLFPEQHYGPAQEAQRLFTGKHVGTPIHLLIKVQAHPDTLLHPHLWTETGSWLREPALNRIAFAVWMQGPVADVRVVSSQVAGAQVHLVLLRHKAAARQTVMELSVSSELLQGKSPTIVDRFEATGSDGFIRVTGIWKEAVHAPRIEVYRGAMVHVQRDLNRDFAQVYANAAKNWGTPQANESYQIAQAYLKACAMVEHFTVSSGCA